MAFLLLSVSLSVSRFTVSVVFFVGLRFYCVTIKVKFYWVQDHKNRIEHKDKLSVQRTHIESCRRTNKRKNGRVGGRRWDSGHVLVKNLQLYSVELCVCVCIVHTTVRHNWTHFSLSVNARRTVLPNNWEKIIFIFTFFPFFCSRLLQVFCVVSWAKRTDSKYFRKFVNRNYSIYCVKLLHKMGTYGCLRKCYLRKKQKKNNGGRKWNFFHSSKLPRLSEFGRRPEKISTLRQPPSPMVLFHLLFLHSKTKAQCDLNVEP